MNKETKLTPKEIFKKYGKKVGSHQQIEVCPECGGTLLTWYVADPLDYHEEGECLDCGAYFTE